MASHGGRSKNNNKIKSGNGFQKAQHVKIVGSAGFVECQIEIKTQER